MHGIPSCRPSCTIASYEYGKRQSTLATSHLPRIASLKTIFSRRFTSCEYFEPKNFVDKHCTHVGNKLAVVF